MYGFAPLNHTVISQFKGLGLIALKGEGNGWELQLKSEQTAPVLADKKSILNSSYTHFYDFLSGNLP